MGNGEKDKWFTVMLAVVIVLLGGLGTMTLVLHQQIVSGQEKLNVQTWNKLDKITILFMHERDLINNKLKDICDKQEKISERVTRIEPKK